MKILRAGVVSVIVAVLGGLASLQPPAQRADPTVDRPTSSSGLRTPFTRDGLPPGAVPATVDAAWFCAAGQVREGIPTTHRVILANIGTSPARGSVTAVPVDAKQKPKSRPVDVAPGGVTTLDLADTGVTGPAAALVDLRSGLVTVEHRLTSRFGDDQVPCVDHPSDRWFFPYASTEKDATVRVVVLNPQPQAVSVDLFVMTNVFSRVPDQFNGAIIPARGVREFNVNIPVPRRDRLAVEVLSRNGPVVAELVQSFDTENITFNATVGEGRPADAKTAQVGGKAPFPRRGVAVSVGLTHLSTEVRFPDGYTQNDVREFVILQNPTDRLANVEVEVIQQGEVAEPPEPFQKTVPPGRSEMVALHGETRVPTGAFHRIVVRSTNSVPVAAALVHFVSDGRVEGATGQMRPPTEAGVSVRTAQPVAARQWAAPSVNLGDGDEGWLVLDNPSSASLVVFKVWVAAGGKMVPSPNVGEQELSPRGQAAIDLTALGLSGSAVVGVSATGPVVVERRLSWTESDDFSAGPAIPVVPTEEWIGRVRGLPAP